MFLYTLFLRHHEKTLGEIDYDQVIQDSLISRLPSSVNPPPPPSPSVWCLMFELTPRVVLHQRECGCVNVCFCVCVWMSSIFILRGGCVCLTNRNNSIAKGMDSTPSLHQGSRYTCCPAHSWPQSRPPPPCFSFLFRLTQRLCNLRSGVAYFTVDSTI